MILFAMIVGIYTVIQFIIDVYRGRTSEYLLVINTIIFTIVILGFLFYGIKSPGISLIVYSIGQIYAYLILIGGTAFLYGVAHFVKEKDWYYYPCNSYRERSCICSYPSDCQPSRCMNKFISSLFLFFGQPEWSTTIQEARGWTPALAWMTFNYGLILMVGGALVMLYNNVKDEHPHQMFALVWSLIMLVSTWQHVRYEYYLAVNVALLSAVCISFAFERGWPDIHRLTTSYHQILKHRKPTREKRNPREVKNRKNSR